MNSVPDPDRHGRELLALVADVARELHPDRARPALTLDSDLARDAGLDSLGRIELMLRVQQHFGASLSEEDAVSAATPRALLAAMGDPSPVAPAAGPALAEAGGTAADASDQPPADAATLVDVLDVRARQQPDTTHVTLLQGLDEVQRLTHAELQAGAERVAGGLRAHGLEPGDTVAIMLPTGLEFFHAFHGTLRAGGVPVPLYPPVRAEQLEDHARRLAKILDNAGCRLFVASRSTRAAGRILQAMVPGLRQTLTVDALQAHRGPADSVPRAGDDLAFLQYTSGTTGHPKGVMLTHANLLANIRAMGPAVAASPADRFVSWLPLYHDMGLIGACLATLYFGVGLVLMSPLHFMARPERWLWAIHRHRATISAAPDFAYGLCAARVDESQLEGLDLSSWRLAFNGAEAISPRTLEQFIRRFEPYGFRAEAMTPVYGLAESSVGLAFPPLGRGVRIDRVDRPALEREGIARPASADDAGAARFVGCGRALEGHEIRVADAHGNALPERREGRVLFRGPSSTAGYYRNPEATRALFRDGWLESGDRGYLAEGEIFLTGRTKDLIIRAGRNIHPEDVETAVSEVEGIRKHGVAAFAVRGSDDDRERLVVMAETREADRDRLDALRRAASDAACAVLDGPPDELVLVAPRTIPKTSSGKIRRSDAREIYLRGVDAAAGSAGALRQALRLAAAGAGPALRRLPAVAGRLAFAGWCWVLALGFAIPGAALVIAVPGARPRAACARGLARAFVALSGTPLVVSGDRQPLRRPHMVVANHASYLDGLALRAILPGRLFFVAKRELARRRSVRLFLQRIGVEFVERGDHRQGLADLERIRARVGHGEHVVVFPEGRLTAGAGLRPFHVGPFMVAVRTGLAVVPVAIAGSRQVLRGEARMPRPGCLRVTIGEPLAPGGDDWNAALALRDRARAFVAAHCGEADLAGPASPPAQAAGPVSRRDRRTGEC